MLQIIINNYYVVCVYLLYVASSALSYSGSLRILSEDGILSRGYLQMYLEGEWRHICQDQMTVGAANSACRQLGYTSAEKFTPRYYIV